MIYHNGACAILPVKEDKFIFVRQFRKALEEDMLEVPAGKIEGTEDPELCAKRELQEETGYAANKMSFLLDFYTAAGRCV